MARILLAWEIGDGHGHVRNLLAVADLLREVGHTIVFAIPTNQVTAAKLVETSGYAVERFMLPHLPSLNQYLPAMVKYRASSFVDILGIYAFNTVDRLHEVASAMRDIIHRNSIELVVAESAPIAMFIAKLASMPCVAVGTSYGLPEFARGFTPFVSLDEAPITQLFKESDILNNTNSVGASSFTALGDCFAPARIIPFCYPSMDHYGQERGLSHRGVGPVWSLPRLPFVKQARGFAYLQQSYPSIKELVSAIRKSGIPFNVFVRNGKFRSAGNMTMLTEFDMQNEMELASFVVHHGSSGIGQAAMGAGRQQVCFPYHIENIQNAWRLQQLGVSKAIGYEQHRDFVNFLLDSNDNRSSNAQVIAAQLEAHANEFQGARVAAAAIDDLL